MPYSQMLSELFPEITLHSEDLLELESLRYVWIPILQNVVDRVHSNRTQPLELQQAILLFQDPMGYL